jgi:radical SAM superfamily enzyme YgiQ (UPF0313 family)
MAPFAAAETNPASPYIDYVVRGQGEDSLLELVNHIEQRGQRRTLLRVSVSSATTS